MLIFKELAIKKKKQSLAKTKPDKRLERQDKNSKSAIMDPKER